MDSMLKLKFDTFMKNHLVCKQWNLLRSLGVTQYTPPAVIVELYKEATTPGEFHEAVHSAVSGKPGAVSLIEAAKTFYSI